MNQLIYVETSIPSFYFETRQQATIQARRLWTREWWEVAKWRDELVSSLWVIRELEETPEPKRSECLDLMQELRLLQSAPEIDEMVEHYIANKVMPAVPMAMHDTWPSPRSGSVMFSPPGTANTSPMRTKQIIFGE